ncbi:MAG TPA: hypothetical protein VHV74_22495 [Pseudonocardiaceae bacterium]|jgi:hypothetical protein|nr:hypothetical protein [Pseudonocardiaceae bacterium]
MFGETSECHASARVPCSFDAGRVLVGGAVLTVVVTRVLGNGGTAADKIRSDAQVTTVGLVFQLVAAALVVVIVARVSAWQNDPTPVDPAADAVRW